MAALEPDDLTELERLGAEARARGEGVLSNPFLQHDALPERTGEDVRAWDAKLKAWASGWRSHPDQAPGTEESPPRY